MRSNSTSFFSLSLLYLCLFLTGICQYTYCQSSWLDDPNQANYLGLNEQIHFEVDWSSVSLIMESEDYDKDNFTSFFDSFPSYSAHNEYIDVDLSESYSYTDIDSIINAFNLSNAGIKSIVPTILIDGTVNRLTKQVVIKKEPGIQKQSLISVAKRFDNNAVVEEQQNDVYTICLNDPIQTISLLRQLQLEGLIAWGQPDFRITLQTFNNDPLFEDQYQLNNTGQNIDGHQLVTGLDVNIEPAWALTKGSPALKVAVFDDGIEMHEDLLVYNSSLGSYRYTTPVKSDYHGMACAGIIGAKHNYVGIKGIAPNAALIGANIFQAGTTISEIASLFYSAVNFNISVINNSWGFMAESGDGQALNPVCTQNLHPAISDAISYAANAGRNGLGTVIVFASGNSESSNPEDHCVTFPANHPDVISVGAITPLGDRASYSSIDSKLDFVVPSSDGDGSYGVVTLDKTGSDGANSGNYNYDFGGTSAAAPVVTGIAALMLSVNPNLSRLDLLQILIDNAVDLGDPGQDDSFGHGLPDAFASVNESIRFITCPDRIKMSGEAFKSEYIANISVESSQLIDSRDVSIKAGDLIELQPNFEVMLGHTFTAILETCN